MGCICRASPPMLEDRPVDGGRKRKAPRLPLWMQEQLDKEELESTVEHKLWVTGAGVLLLGLFSRGVVEVEGVGSILQAVAAGTGAFLLVDLLSGVYHWGIDNYGSASTPVFGKQIAGFQGHHEWPWTITHREFCNNVHTICKPAIPVVLMSLTMHPPFFMDIFLSVGTTCAILAQQFHSWAHTKRSQLPASVALLQDVGILVSTAEHCRHHRQPFNSNYCIVAGFWNKFLDDSRIFPFLEEKIYESTGVAPRCWSEKHDEDASYFGGPSTQE